MYNFIATNHYNNNINKVVSIEKKFCGAFLPTWRRFDEAAAIEMRAIPVATAAVFSAPSEDDPAVSFST